MPVSNGRPVSAIRLDRLDPAQPNVGVRIDARGAVFLSQGLRTEPSQDDYNTTAIVNTTVGSVVRYAIHNTKAGKYAVTLSVASGQANTLAQLALEMYLDGEIAATFNANATGGDHKWVKTNSYDVEIPLGWHTLEFRWKSDGLNMSRILIAPAK